MNVDPVLQLYSSGRRIITFNIKVKQTLANKMHTMARERISLRSIPHKADGNEISKDINVYKKWKVFTTTTNNVVN